MARELMTALDGLPQTDNEIPIRNKTNEMLEVAKPPTDPKGMRECLELYQRQTRAISLWQQGWSLYRLASPLYADLQDRQDDLLEADRARLHDSDPEALYRTPLEPAASLEDLTDAGALARLRDSYRVLLALDRAYPASRFGAAAAEGPALELPVAAAPFVAEGLRLALSPEEIVAMVRGRDRVDFWVTFILTALAFLVTIYVGKDFGSIWQYLAAFLAGATGQLVVNWALLPWYRSYRVASTPPSSTS
jgi:hypothetical protein